MASVYETSQVMHDRMLRGSHALQAYADKMFGLEADRDLTDADATYTVAGDLIADILHFCDYRGLDIDSVLEHGRFHFHGDFEDVEDED